MHFLFRLDLSLQAGAGNFFFGILNYTTKQGLIRCNSFEILNFAFKQEQATMAKQYACKQRHSSSDNRPRGLAMRRIRRTCRLRGKA
jgi:hypothetical protein